MKNILVLYHGQSMYTRTVQDFVDSFGKYSRHTIHYLHAGHDTRPAFDFDAYDALVLTYACRLCYLENMSPHVRERIRGFRGLKVAFVQDEYQEVNKLRAGILELGIGLVFTCVPEEKISWVYPPEIFPGVRFVRVLTGYVPERLQSMPRACLPDLANRPTWVGYRGRDIGYNLGDLSFFKIEIGRRFKAACERRGMPHDIAWTEDARIYQEQWFSFLAGCRTTLGVPSGCNVFDWDGAIARECKDLREAQPDLTYEQYRPRIAHKEQEIDMGQISPRAFESVALGTVLVLLEGQYSGVLTAGKDYIEVRRDFSNLEQVLEQIGDVEHLKSIANHAYENVIASQTWSYRGFISQVDAEMDAALPETGPAIRLNAPHFSQPKACDQSFLEEYALKANAQYPMSRWLDLSHLRQSEEGHKALLSQVLASMGPSTKSNRVNSRIRALLRKARGAVTGRG